MKTILTGIKPTGQIHIGNYLGAMKPAIEACKLSQDTSYLFIADYHALTATHDKATFQEMVYEVAAAWIACGIDPKKTVVYLQSDVPEIFELAWILSCFTPKGFMNRAHAYKAKIAENEQNGKKDLDFGVNMGLFNYPVLMTADILAFDAHEVPVGEDQIQHLEFARDIAQKFNNNYGETLKMPNPIKKGEAKLITGIDGRKMSKSYSNSIPLFAPEKKLRKLVMKVKTDSLAPEAPKDPEGSLPLEYFKEFATDEEVKIMLGRYKEGVAWGDVKQNLFEVMNREISPMRQVYDDLMADKSSIDAVLKEGASKARERSQDVISRVRMAIGKR
ncbi:MAG: tryptophan--tRNA ligase [Bdellovibrionaceae bacterium]|jgi:tryptophanyl-tRNA synthetase|nr:tryptophan--tRNA ligase [Pseudobdellovibrionaceae bacterium]